MHIRGLGMYWFLSTPVLLHTGKGFYERNRKLKVSETGCEVNSESRVR